MKSSIQNNRFRSNLGTQFSSSNGLGFEDFRADGLFKWTRFPRGIGNNFCIYRFSSNFFARLYMILPHSLLKSPRGPGFSCY
jgi:hypothetical protein